MGNLIVGACVGFIVGIWFSYFTMRAIFKKLKSEIGSQEAGNWEKSNDGRVY